MLQKSGILLCVIFWLTSGAFAQISFLSDDIVTGLSSPTTLQVGPDARLYVGQQNGTIQIYTISRSAPGDYSVTSTETVTLVKNIMNHDDDGDENPGQGDRQVTGIMVLGTANNPIMYVSSSDPRIAVGNDSNLDTNSGLVTRLTWVGTDLTDPAGYWDMVHLVRGLPRSEENHATNGMSLDASSGLLYLTAGGFTNKGAPGNNFSGTPEYALSAAILQIDLNAIEAMPVYTDLRTGEKFIYDIPTLDDPTRTNIDNTDPDFPYAPGHPNYSSSIDPGDPYGGNNGLNQARWVQGGPVQVYAGGFRNPYDVVFTSQNRVYSIDNGPNGGWGGVPKTYDNTDTEISNDLYDPALGHYVTNEFNESNSNKYGDGLHHVTPGYFAGHPNPTRANPTGSDLYVYEKVGGSWQQAAGSPYDFMTDFPAPPVPASLARPSEGISQEAGDIAMADVNTSTNGLCEYTASNFGGALQGILLTASFNDNIIAYELDATGNVVVSESNLLSGNGDNPLDVWAQGDGVDFPGTIWVAFHGANKVMVFEPNDFAPFNCTGADDISLDEDGDGYTNADEIDNGTDPCNQGDRPEDYDGDFVSNLNDSDDDNDGLLDTYDPFPVDPNNGTTTNLPISYGFSIDNANSIPGTLFGLGFTGVMTNGDFAVPTPGDDYQSLYDINDFNLGGATGKLGIENVAIGTADGASNDQEDALQFGLNVDVNSAPFTVVTEVESPFFLVNGNPLPAPIDDQQMGLYLGTGDQDNFLKIVMHSHGGAGGIRVTSEINGVSSTNDYSVPGMLGVTAVNLYLEVSPDPVSPTAAPKYSLNGGNTVVSLGAALPIPASWLAAGDNFGLAIGVISSAVNSATPFDATWDYLYVTSAAPVITDTIPDRTVLQGATDDLIDLNTHFDDDQGNGNLTYSITGNDGNYVSAVISGSDLTLSYPAANNDTATIKVRATDVNGYFIEDSFVVRVIDPLVTLYRVNAGGSELITLDYPNPNWDIDGNGGYASIYRNTGSNLSGTSYDFLDPSVPAYVPTGVWDQERWDAGGDPNMIWSFPAPKAGAYEVHLFFMNNSNNTDQVGERVFDVSLEGSTWLEDYDIIADVGHKTGVMKSTQVQVVDGVLNIEFGREVENPIISAIEILGPPQNDFTGELAVTPQPMHFFSTEVGTTSANQDITLTNVGGDPIQVSAMSIGGTDAAEFAMTTDLPYMIAPGASVIVPMNFSPASVGSKSAELSVTHTGENVSPQIMEITGEAIPNGASVNVFGRVNGGGPSNGSATGYGIDWAEDQAANAGNAGGNANGGNTSSALAAGGENTFGTADIISIDDGVAPSAGPAVFQTMRYDPSGGDNMTYEFAVVPGTMVQIRLFFAETVFNSAGSRVFDVSVEGSVPAIFDDLDIYQEAGVQNKAVMKSYITTVTDAILTLEFLHGTGDPMISAIELTDIGNASAFPVTWLGLNAELTTNGVAVTWKTSSEYNSDYFQVERSTDGGDFETLGYVKGAGTTQAINTYNFLDMQHAGNSLRYRIRQVDFDGHFSFSNEVELVVPTEQLFAFPNPASDLVTIMLPQVDESMNLQILDMSGKIWYREHIEYAPQDGKQISVSELPDGVYVIMLNFRDGRKQSLRLVKQVR